MSDLKTITPDRAAALVRKGAVLIDVREAHEHAAEHIPGARLHALSTIDQRHPIESGDTVLIFHCKSGMRTAANADALAACSDAPVYLMEGGFDAWQKAGLECNVDRKAPLEIMRQVQIGAGSLVLLGVLLGFFVSPMLFGLSAFVGAGLVMAGTTGWCGMAKLLAHAPWNRRAAA